ncbi:MAG TPA: two-component regulator propeller domain-containing protein, partial [Puia sp.]|nr:two-component regulator propeller domain-containing protein [Puia sp.]
MSTRLFIILTFCLVHAIVNAQPYYFRNYQVNDGISSNTITCTTQDAKGFMWFGTRSGLNRFDGASFKVFRHDSKDSASIGSNSILSLYADADQRLWVGTYKGLYIYDPQYENFSLVKSIPEGEVRDIRGDNGGYIWIVAGQILYRFDKTSGKAKACRPDSSCVALAVSGNGIVWSAAADGVISRFSNRTQETVRFDVGALHGTNSPVFIQTLYPVSDTAILIATLKQVLLFNTRTSKLTNVFAGESWQNNIQVHKILEQSPGIFWFGTETGIYILDMHTNKSEHIGKQYADPYGINDNTITDLCKDREGNIWVGTFFGGVNYYSKQLSQFQKYFPMPGKNSLSGNLVHEICADRNNNLWIGTEDAGLNKLDLKTGIFHHFMPGKQRGDISYQNVHGLLADGDRLWIGTYEHGLDVMDLRTEKVIRHYEKGNTPNSLSSNFIVCLYKTRGGDILVGTWSGLYKYNPAEDNFLPLPYFNRQAQAILEDRNGTLWVCSYGNGVYYYNARTGAKGSFTYNPNDPASLSNNYVNNLFEDSRGNIWFCTESGLCRYSPVTGRIKRSSASPALRDNQVFRVLEDNSGTLWITTSKGLISLESGSDTTHIYTADNGLLSEQFNYNSAYKGSDGALFFGTVKGMIRFNPAAIVRNRFVPPVYITGLQANNYPLHLRADPDQQEALPYTYSLTLPYDSSNISIEAAALSYTMPTLNRYLFKMEGLDKSWTLSEGNRKIYYTKLAPGHYTFMIKGSNGDEVWNKRFTQLRITILPPWWASWWAYTLYALIAAAIVLVIFRYYHIAVREKNERIIKTLEIEKEREVYNAKIEFFTNVTHEIRTPLTLIRLPLEKLMKTFSKNVILHEHLAMIEKNTDRLIHLTNQLLDFRKAEANNYTLNFVRTDINELLRDLFLLYKPAAEEKKLSFKLEMPRMPLLAYVDAEALRKIISNLLSNALKYSSNAVSIRLLPFNSDDFLFHIEFRSDGEAIPSEMKEKIFEPFFRLKQSEKYTGTGIGLPLARSLAELHKGKLELKQASNGLNLFLLSLPVHQDFEINLNESETIEHGPAENEPPVSIGPEHGIS